MTTCFLQLTCSFRFPSTLKIGASHAIFKALSGHSLHEVCRGQSRQHANRVIRSQAASQNLTCVVVRNLTPQKEKARRWNSGLFRVTDEARQGKNRVTTHQWSLMDCTEPCCACQHNFFWHRGSMYRSPKDVRCTSLLYGHAATLAGVGYVRTT